MLKHLSNRPATADHGTLPHALANGYVSAGRYCNVPSKIVPSQQHQQQQQQQLHQLHHQQQQQQQQLHVSLLNTSKHSLSPTTSVSPGTANHTKTTLTNLDHSRDESLPFNFSGGPLSSSIFITDRSLPNGNHTFLSNSGLSGEKGMNGLLSNGGSDIRRDATLLPAVNRTAAVTRPTATDSVIGVREMLTSLGLLCLVSLMMALMALLFLLKMNPPSDVVRFDQVRIISPEESAVVYEVSLALCSLSLTLDVCCCLVCAAQLIFAARLFTASTYSMSNSSRERIKEYLKDSAATRICAIAGFFVSIPVFLTDIILYTILQFPSTPAISTSIVVTLGIVLSGCAMLHSIAVWQKLNSSRSSRNLLPDLSAIESHPKAMANGKVTSPSQLPVATLDLSGLMAPNANANLSNHMLELSTLVWWKAFHTCSHTCSTCVAFPFSARLASVRLPHFTAQCFAIEFLQLPRRNPFWTIANHHGNIIVF